MNYDYHRSTVQGTARRNFNKREAEREYMVDCGYHRNVHTVENIAAVERESLAHNLNLLNLAYFQFGKYHPYKVHLAAHSHYGGYSD